MRRLAVVGFAYRAGRMRGRPDYVRPVVDIPAAFSYEDTEAAETANTAWWTQFQIHAGRADRRESRRQQEPQDRRGPRRAGRRSPDPVAVRVLPAGELRRRRDETAWSELGAVPVPPSVPNPQVSYQPLAGASWEIDLWGRIRRLSEAAQANLLATEEARRGVILSLVASVASSYIQLLGLDEQLAVARRNLATYGESVTLFERKLEYGQVSGMNVEQARTQYETAAAAIPQIESAIAQTENALSVLLGRNPGPVARGKTLDQLALPAIPAALPSDVLANRPDVLQAEQALVAANAQIGAARALYFPAISLTGAFGFASEQLSNLFKGPARVWSYSGSLTGPLFTGGAISGQVRQAEAGGRPPSSATSRPSRVRSRMSRARWSRGRSSASRS